MVGKLYSEWTGMVNIDLLGAIIILSQSGLIFASNG
jgi:hypothetical protein